MKFVKKATLIGCLFLIFMQNHLLAFTDIFQPSYSLNSEEKKNTSSFNILWEENNLYESNSLWVNNKTGKINMVYSFKNSFLNKFGICYFSKQNRLGINENYLISAEQSQNAIQFLFNSENTLFNLNLEPEINKTQNRPTISGVNYDITLFPKEKLHIGYIAKNNADLYNMHIKNSNLDRTFFFSLNSNKKTFFLSADLGFEYKAEYSDFCFQEPRENLDSNITGIAYNLPGNEYKISIKTPSIDASCYTIYLTKQNLSGELDAYYDTKQVGYAKINADQNIWGITFEHNKTCLPFEFNFENKLLNFGNSYATSYNGNDVFSNLVGTKTYDFSGLNLQFYHFTFLFKDCLSSKIKIQYSQILLNGKIDEYEKILLFNNLTKSNGLEIEKIDYLILDLEKNINIINNLDLKINLSQIIPISIKKRTTQEKSSNSNQQNNISDNAKGGTKINFEVTYVF
jgi:hypothetical protein